MSSIHTVQLYFKTSKEWQLHKIPMEIAENSKETKKFPHMLKVHIHTIHNVKQLDNEIRTLYKLIMNHPIIFPF